MAASTPTPKLRSKVERSKVEVAREAAWEGRGSVSAFESPFALGSLACLAGSNWRLCCGPLHLLSPVGIARAG